MSTLEQLETRIRQLEQKLQAATTAKQRQSPEIWMAQCRPLPEESWPTDFDERVFDAMLVEPSYDPSSDTDYSTEDLGDPTDNTKGSWIKIASPIFLHELDIVLVWRHQLHRTNWYAMPWPEDLIVTTPAGGITARSGTTVSSALCTVRKLTGTGTTRTVANATNAEGSSFTTRVFCITTGDDVAAEVDVVTRVLATGERYIVVESCDA